MLKFYLFVDIFQVEADNNIFYYCIPAQGGELVQLKVEETKEGGGGWGYQLFIKLLLPKNETVNYFNCSATDEKCLQVTFNFMMRLFLTKSNMTACSKTNNTRFYKAIKIQNLKSIDKVLILSMVMANKSFFSQLF